MRVAAVPLLKMKFPGLDWKPAWGVTIIMEMESEEKRLERGCLTADIKESKTSLHCHILSFTIWDCEGIKPCYAARPVVLFSEMWLRWEIPDPVVEI